MADTSFLGWPFFDAEHRALAPELDAWAHAESERVEHGDVDEACRQWVARLGAAGCEGPLSFRWKCAVIGGCSRVYRRGLRGLEC